MKNWLSAACSLLSILLLSGCAGTSSQITETANLFAMDTFATVTIHGREAKEGVTRTLETIRELDILLSVGNPESQVYQINETGSATLSPETEALLCRALELEQETEGAFNPLLQPIMEAWGFRGGEPQLPEKEVIAQLLPLTQVSQISLEGNRLQFLQEGMKLDFGGIAKGYATDRIGEALSPLDVTGGIVNLGGNVRVFGRKPDNTLWKIGVSNPLSPEDTLGVLEATDVTVITSGAYERYLEIDGKRYHHLMNPATGYPADSDLLSVTIVTADGTLGDALSTALFVMGREKAIQYYQSHPGCFEMILVDNENTLYLTEEIFRKFSTDWKPLVKVKSR